MTRNPTQPAPRIGRDIPSFSQEDKFEVCLNLTPLVKVQASISDKLTWAEVGSEGLYTPVLTAEHAADFEAHGWTPDMVGSCVVSPLVPARIQQRILSNKVLITNLPGSIRRKMNAHTEYVTKHNLYVQLRHFLTATLSKLYDLNMQCFPGWKQRISELPLQVMNALAVQEDLQEILNASKALQGYVHGPTRQERAVKRVAIGGEESNVRSLNATAHVMKGFIILTYEGTNYLIPTVYFLEIYGKVTEMVNLLLYTHFSSGTTLPSNHWDVSLLFLRHCCKELLRTRRTRPALQPENQRIVNDNQGFLYMKTMEALGVGMMSRREDAENFQEENELLLDTMWQSLHEEGVVREDNVRDSELFEILLPLETCQIADLLGTVKIFGHPIIDIVGGLSKLEARVKKKLEIDNATLRNSLGK